MLTIFTILTVLRIHCIDYKKKNRTKNKNEKTPLLQLQDERKRYKMLTAYTKKYNKVHGVLLYCNVIYTIMRGENELNLIYNPVQ